MALTVRAWHPEVPALREVFHARFDHSYPMHTHDAWAVFLVDEGAVSFGLDRSDHHVSPQHLVLLPPGIPHDGRPAMEGAAYRKRVLYLEPDWLPADLAGLAARTPELPDAAPLRTAHAVHAALAAPEPTDPSGTMAAEQGLLTLRDEILRRYDRAAPGRPDAPLARRLRDLLDDHLTEPLTIARAAELLGAHPSHLVRAFSQAYGIPPHQYVLGRRVDRARRLLVDGHRPAEAATAVGFHDQAHLTRHLRRVLGVTPSALAA